MPSSLHAPHPALLVDSEPVSTVEVAETFRARSKGLLGRDGVDGALLLKPAMSVHTFRMRFTIDVAFCDRNGRVLAVREMRPGRMSLLRPGCRSVLEAEAGSFARWGLVAGSTVMTG